MMPVQYDVHEAVEAARKQERERAEMVLRGVGWDESRLPAKEPAGAPYTDREKAFILGFEHCRTKAIAILLNGAESWEPK
jgi:hypothetical protein